MTAPKSDTRATSSATTTGSGSPTELSENHGNQPDPPENQPVVPDSVTDVMERTHDLLGALRLSERSLDAGRRSEAVEEGKESDELREVRTSATSTSTTASTRTSTNNADSPDRRNVVERPDMAIHIYEELHEELHDEADQQRRRPMRHRSRRRPRTAAPTADAQESSDTSTGTTNEESTRTARDQLAMALTPEVSERHPSLYIYQALMEQSEIEEATEIAEETEHRRERRATSPCARGA